MAEAKELVKIIKYIEEREKNLSRYSDKLRFSLDRLFSVFGDKDLCRYCGYGKTVYLNAPGDYQRLPHDEAIVAINKMLNPTEENVKWLQQRFEGWRKDPKFKASQAKDLFPKIAIHRFTPKIEVSIDLFDEQPFYRDEDLEEDAYLAFHDHLLKIVFLPWNAPKDFNLASEYSVWQVGRFYLKQLVKSGRLIKFLEYTAKKLKEYEQEYREVSELAEKLAKAVEVV